MIQIHHLEQSRSTRIIWLLEELGLDYEIVEYKRDPETQFAPESLKKIHPLGKSPIITDGDLTIAESGAIIEYILDEYGQGRLKPTEKKSRLDYRYWLHFAEGSLMPLLVMELVLGKTAEAPMPFFVRPVAKKIVGAVDTNFTAPRLSSQLNYINQHLGLNSFFAGDSLSGADIQMAIALQLYRRLSPDAYAQYKHINRYILQIENRESYQKALKAG